MIYGLKTVMKYLLGTDKANRNLRVYADDGCPLRERRNPTEFYP